MIRLLILIAAVLFTDVLFDLPASVAGPDQNPGTLPAEDYALYDQVVTSKFLTSATQLVVIERTTQFRLSPDQEGPTTLGAFQERAYFNGELPADLIREFTSINRQPSRLEGHFHFGVSYRFATGDRLDEPEASLTPSVMVARRRLDQAPSVLDRMAFSRVARSLRSDHALLYVEILRPDSTGAGFLVWFLRKEGRWTPFDTEVTWTIQPQWTPEDGPLLAP